MSEKHRNPVMSLEIEWKEKLADAQLKYLADNTAENAAEYRRVLRIYADIVLREKLPSEPEP